MPKVTCNVADCSFCSTGGTGPWVEHHCCADSLVELEFHWVDDDQTLIACKTFESRREEENG